jgi:hypothetical protein
MAKSLFQNRGTMKVSARPPAVPTGNIATPQGILKATYDTWVKTQITMRNRPQPRGRRLQFPPIASFAQWVAMQGGGGAMSLADGMSGLGADFFTNIGKSLKAGIIKAVAKPISKLTGVSNAQVTADLNKVKTKINVASIILKNVKSAPSVEVTPVTTVPLQQAADLSAGTPATQQGNGTGILQGKKGTFLMGNVALPSYALPVAGGVLVLGVVYYVYAKKKSASTAA